MEDKPNRGRRRASSTMEDNGHASGSRVDTRSHSLNEVHVDLIQAFGNTSGRNQPSRDDFGHTQPTLPPFHTLYPVQHSPVLPSHFGHYQMPPEHGRGQHENDPSFQSLLQWPLDHHLSATSESTGPNHHVHVTDHTMIPYGNYNTSRLYDRDAGEYFTNMHAAPQATEAGPSQTSTHPQPRTRAARTESQTDNPEDSYEEKRRRNTVASARFRIKKKQRAHNLEHAVADLTGRATELEREATELRRENTWLKEIVVLKGKNNLARNFQQREAEEPELLESRSKKEKKKGKKKLEKDDVLNDSDEEEEEEEK